MRSLLYYLLPAAAGTAVPVSAAEVCLLPPCSGGKLIAVQGKLEIGGDKTFSNVAVLTDHAQVVNERLGEKPHVNL